MRILSHDLGVDDLYISLCAFTARIGEIKLVLIVYKGQMFACEKERATYTKSYKWNGSTSHLKNNIKKFVYKTPETDNLIILEALSALSDIY